MQSKHIITGVFGAAMAFAIACMLAFAAMAVSTAPAYADDDYYITVSGNGPFDFAYGFCGKPGQQVNWKINAETNYYDEGELTLEGATYKWTIDPKLKAKVNGSKVVIKKLPKKAGKYKLKVTAYDSEGTKVAVCTNKVIVAKKPAVKIQLTAQGKSIKNVKRNDMIMMHMKNALFGWDNNTKKPFYTWTVKNLNTGKTATWNSKKESFNKNAFISGSSVGGGGYPVFMGTFEKTGKYKVTAVVYHSNKKIATATKTFTVK